MRKVKRIAILIGGVIIGSAFTSLAQDKTVWTNLHFVRQTEAWLKSNNAAGLKYTPVDTISEISFSGSFNKGDYINYNQSNQSYSYGGQVESYFRLNSRVVLFGDLEYEKFEGRNMGASAWIDPEFAPFNLVEYTDTTRGVKAMERYRLVGAVAIDLTEKLTVGGNINYCSSDYVKKKDLRHLNMLMDLNLSVGGMYRIGRFADLGLNYCYRKRVEEIKFDSYGNTDRTYSTLISWGTFWGQVESFGSDGLTGKNDNNPLVDKINGLSLQFKLKLNRQLSFFNEFTIKERKGYFGVKSDQTKVYTRHSADVLTYKGCLSYTREKVLHLLNLQVLNDKLENWKNNYYFDYDSESGVTYVKYNTPTKVLKRTNIQASVEYQLYIDYDGFNPKWSIIAGADYRNREQKVSVYPFYRNQTVNQMTGRLNVKRNFVFGKNQYTFLLGGSFSRGRGTRLDAGTYAGSTETTTSLRSTDFNLYREYEYLTKPCMRAQAGFKYSRLLKQNKLRAFTGISYQFQKAFDPEYIAGNSFNSLNFSLGCAF